MRLQAAGLLVACLVLGSASETSAAVPRALYGKSLVVSWTESRNQQFPDGTRNQRVVTTAFTIYFSHAGRKFSKSARLTLSRTGNESFATAYSRGPGGSIIKTSNSRYFPVGRFVGHTYVSTVRYENGARQLKIAFDPEFRHCTLDLTFGKEPGAPGLVMRGSSGRLLMLTSIDISSPSCAITDGNLIAD
jgi:hypothetical protein